MTWTPAALRLILLFPALHTPGGSAWGLNAFSLIFLGALAFSHQLTFTPRFVTSNSSVSLDLNFGDRCGLTTLSRAALFQDTAPFCTCGRLPFIHLLTSCLPSSLEYEVHERRDCESCCLTLGSTRVFQQTGGHQWAYVEGIKHRYNVSP